MKKDEIIQDIRRVASDLGHTPSRREYVQHSKIGWAFDRTFGSWTVALAAAGLDQPKFDKKTIFVKNIETHLDEYNAKPKSPRIILPDGFMDIVIVGDTHFPFVDVNALTSLYSFIDETKPKRCVQIGDLYDMFSHSKFPRSHNLFTPDQEMQLGREGAQKMWSTIQKLSPGIECYQLLGNHDVRPLKRVTESFPSLENFVVEAVARLMTFDGVHTIHDYREELLLDGICFIHGYQSKLGAHRDFNLCNVACGHSHKGGVVYRPHKDQTFWELNAGYLGDPHAKALSYTPQRTTGWTHGFGYIDRNGPRFICA